MDVILDSVFLAQEINRIILAIIIFIHGGINLNLLQLDMAIRFI